MTRDMMKTADLAHENIPGAYDLTCGELTQLMEIAIPEELRSLVPLDGVYDAITVAFRYGFVLGSRAQRNDRIGVKL